MLQKSGPMVLGPEGWQLGGMQQHRGWTSLLVPWMGSWDVVQGERAPHGAGPGAPGAGWLARQHPREPGTRLGGGGAHYRVLAACLGCTELPGCTRGWIAGCEFPLGCLLGSGWAWSPVLVGQVFMGNGGDGDVQEEGTAPLLN